VLEGSCDFIFPRRYGHPQQTSLLRPKILEAAIMPYFRYFLPGFGVSLLLLLALNTSISFANKLGPAGDGIGIKRPVQGLSSAVRAEFSTSQLDTIYVGYLAGSRSATNPYGVGVGGVWDFDQEISGTDSTQFWQFFLAGWRFFSTSTLPLPGDRPSWYFDHGNEVNIGDTNLWLDRENRGMHSARTGDAATAGYLRTGITGYWHVDDMAGVSAPVAGANSAWCGLRGPNDFSYTDEVTGNPLSGDLARFFWFGGAVIGSWPGYGDQIEQILYHDFDLVNGDGSDQLSFDYRTDMSSLLATENNGSAWFNPDPTSAANFVLNPMDSLMVWVGLPTESAYDVNKRWLSEVLDFGSASQPVKVFADTGLSGGNVSVPLPAFGAATTVRVAFQVKTNRSVSDETFELSGFDSAEGAALIDDVRQNGVLLINGDFEAANAIRPRFSLPGGGVSNENSPSTFWITTGKPPAGYGHIHNVFDLPYNDPCGALGSPDRLCDLIDNTLVLSNHDDPDHAFFEESWVSAESPTIPLYDGSPIQNALNAQSLDLFRLEYQLWTGTMDRDQAVFWNVGARYHGPTFTQLPDSLVPGWSINGAEPAIYSNADPACFVINTGTRLDGIIPPPSRLDSMKVFVWIQTRCARFGATVLCGKPEGGYFDNIRVCFTGGEGAAITAQFWDLLADTFPFNEEISPGSANFDTTTALIKQGMNRAGIGEGVIVGDTLAVISDFEPGGRETRLDFVFRIKPGPGNYSVKGDPSSPLWKTPSDPTQGVASAGDGSFFGQYLANPGPYSKGDHTAGWDWTTWNSARMDSAERNISPLAGRNLGIPVGGWQGTLHEEDPNYITLGVTRNICFLVDPNGSAISTNICCSAATCAVAPFFDSWPPLAYPAGTLTTTIEGTKILPDGIFTPGTHIEYFMRRSDAPEGVAGVSVTPDTTVASQQAALGPHFDGQRFLEIGVFPDLWKDISNGGQGLACMLVVDAADRRGQEHTVIGTLDSLGYGKNNGAGRGWWENDPSTSNPNPDDPDNWIFPNLGQKGLAFDWFDVQASESGEADRPGCRLATAPPDLADRQCKQGPTPDMLKAYYNTILWMGGDLVGGVLHDGIGPAEQSDDVALVTGFLASSSSGNERAVWLAGDGAANDLANSNGGAPTLLTEFFATLFIADSYRTASGNISTPSAVINLISEFNAPRPYGYNNSCALVPDVISANGAVADGVLAQRYEDSSDGDVSINPGLYGSVVYRPADNASRFYTTLISGYQIPNLLGSGFQNTQTDAGRMAFVDDALVAFNLCAAIGPVVAIGDLPGASGAQLNLVRGAFPNPALAGPPKVNFSLAQAAKVTFRLYNVAGRLLHEETKAFEAGHQIFQWDGHITTGMRVAPGVYFYRLSAPGVTFENNRQRMVLLGGN
jgi:hypothetical protein